MLKLSELLKVLIIGNPAYGATKVAHLKNVTISRTDWIVDETTPGVDLKLMNNGHFTAEKVWNAVWNDFADFQKLNDQLVYGKCYYDTVEGARICNQRCQLSVIGIASDTFGSSVGQNSFHRQAPIAVAGWVLAFVDQEYEPGTPLTNDENGNLTKMTSEEKREFPERLVAIYKAKELSEEFGTTNSKIKVNGRHWVKVK